jgi:hypothetical protein
MKFSNRILPVMVVVLAFGGAAASGKTRVTVVPPGDSGISQYAEVVPTGAGGSPPQAGGGGQTSVLSASQRSQLSASGPNGRTLEAVVDATAPQTFGISVAGAPQTRSSGRSGAAGGSKVGGPDAGIGAAAAPELHSATAASPVSMLLGAAAGNGDGGVGYLLPGFMLASACAALVLALRRRRMSP